MSDLSDLLLTEGTELLLYADDILVNRPINNEQDCITLQEDLDKLMQWEKKWEMEFNPSKCIVLNITKKKKKISFDYRLHGQVLETVDNAKYLIWGSFMEQAH